MIKQILFYNFEIIKVNDFSFSINALFLISLTFLFLFLKDKNKYFKFLLYICFMMIVVAINNTFIFNFAQSPIIEKDSISKIMFFVYSILFYPIQSLSTFFMAQSILLLVVFILAYPIFKSLKIIMIIIVILQLLNIIFNILGFTSNNFSFYKIFLMLVGTFIGYGITLIKKK